MPPLHTAFNSRVNTPFNNSLLSARTIEGMHPSAERLYRIAAELDPPIVGQSAVARWLNESPQTVNNWESESRGVSRKAALKVQERTGYSAKWLLDGKAPEKVAELAHEPKGSVFNRLDEREQRLLEDFRRLTDNDRARYSKEIAERAAELRGYLAQEMAKLGLPTP